MATLKKKKKRRRFNVKRAIELFLETPSWRAVARKMKVYPYSVQQQLQKYGLKSQKGSFKDQKRTWDLEGAVKLKKEGKSWDYIAEQVGKDKRYVAVQVSKFLKKEESRP